jgi:cytochrome P450
VPPPLPPLRAWHKLDEWTKEYGPVFSYRQGPRIFVVIGRQQVRLLHPLPSSSQLTYRPGGIKAATDILEKHGAALTDRPRAVAAGETVSGGMRILLVGAGAHWRRLRRALHAHMHRDAAAAYAPVQLANAKTVVRDVLDRPQDHIAHARR